VPRLNRRVFRAEFADLPLADIVHVSTPSYSGTHVDGFHAAVRALAEQLCVEQTPPNGRVNLMPGFVSPADMRHLKELVHAFGLDSVMLPDYSETLDGPALLDYENIPSGARPWTASAPWAAAGLGGACRAISGQPTAGTSLKERFGVPLFRLGLPMGIRETDALFDALKENLPAARPRASWPWNAAATSTRWWTGTSTCPECVRWSTRGGSLHRPDELSCEIGVVPVLVPRARRTATSPRTSRPPAAAFCAKCPWCARARTFSTSWRRRAPCPRMCWWATARASAPRGNGACPFCAWASPSMTVSGASACAPGYRGAQQLFEPPGELVLEKRQNDSDIGYGYL
jgi:nitrogenase molybdenum-iron protein NifN